MPASSSSRSRSSLLFFFFCEQPSLVKLPCQPMESPKMPQALHLHFLRKTVKGFMVLRLISFTDVTSACSMWHSDGRRNKKDLPTASNAACSRSSRATASTRRAPHVPRGVLVVTAQTCGHGVCVLFNTARKFPQLRWRGGQRRTSPRPSGPNFPALRTLTRSCLATHRMPTLGGSRDQRTPTRHGPPPQTLLVTSPLWVTGYCS